MSGGEGAASPSMPSGSDMDWMRNIDENGMVDFIQGLRLRDPETGAPDPAEVPPNWLEQEIGALPLWSKETNYQHCQFCMNCMLNVSILASEFEKRDTPQFNYKNLREVNTLFHILPHRMRDNYTPVNILEEAIAGCPLCSLAISSSWAQGNTPFDTARWARNPLWRKRAQYLLFGMYPWRAEDSMARPLLQLIYGTKLTTGLYPEADMSEFWGAIHMWTSEELQKWYDAESCAYTLQSNLGPPPFPTLASSTDHLDIIEISKWWLARCLGEHKSCLGAREQVDATHHPTRLLYTGTAPEYKDAKLIINNHHDNTNVREYFALSYCWGKKDFPRLTQSTMSLFQEEINPESLPATLGQAIQITRLLGYSYLWIDALCIIQDSKDDWLAESVKMGSIYRKAVLTIAALGAIDAFQGLFTVRNPLCYQDLRLSKSDFIFSHRAGNVDPGFKREFEVLGPAASPLQTRAWCVQEHALAPRTLFFGSSGVFWQCLECEADEGYPRGTKSEHPNIKAHISTCLSSGDFDLRKVWRAILDRYSGCKLTYASDKLVAIYGIAQLLSKASGVEFVAGLWEKYLHRDLLWHSQKTHWTDQTTLQRLSNGCPTFSWTSVAQPVNFFKYDSEEETLQDADSISLMTNRTGDQLVHELKIRTQMREVALLPPAYSKTGEPYLMLAEDAPPLDSHAWGDEEISKDMISRLGDPVRLDWTIDRKTDEDRDLSHFGPFSYSWIRDLPLDGSVTRAWYMCIARQHTFDPPAAVGLIVVPNDASRSHWKRIGFLSHFGFNRTFTDSNMRVIVTNGMNNEIEWEETAKTRAPNPFLANPDREWIEVILE
jgi:hypothetical protein